MLALEGRKNLITRGSRRIGAEKAILFLASELARHTTGEILNGNGGSVRCA